jgi:uncharacterized membrane protein
MAELIDKESNQKIVEAIKVAEKDTSGEIRVHIQKKAKGDIFDLAKEKFDKLGMAATEQKNGVLIFIAMQDRQFAILGDEGINECVPDDFWNETVDKMKEFFKKGDFAGGVEAGVLSAGKALLEFFPYQKDDINELSDEVSIDEEN